MSRTAAAPPIPVFDIGGVLLDWNPRHLYARLIPNAAAREHFLDTVCTPAWNLEQDRGRPWDLAVGELVARHPDQADLIRAYDERWPEMVSGPIVDTVAILETLLDAGHAVYSITNFSEAKFDLCRARFGFLNRFAGIVVSGHERLVKPDPAIYRCLLDRHGLAAEDCLFIDDAPANVAGARSAGMQAIAFTTPERLRADLVSVGLL
jgi:2-haloacid dehalogenase